MEELNIGDVVRVNNTDTKAFPPDFGVGWTTVRDLRGKDGIVAKIFKGGEQGRSDMNWYGVYFEGWNGGHNIGGLLGQSHSGYNLPAIVLDFAGSEGSASEEL